MESFEIVEATLHNILLVRIIQVVNEFVFCFYLEKGRRWWPSLLGVVACDSHHDVVFIRRHCRCIKAVLIIIIRYGNELWLYWLCCDFEAGLKADYFFVECCELLLCEVGGIVCIDFWEYLHKRHWYFVSRYLLLIGHLARHLILPLLLKGSQLETQITKQEKLW